MPTESVRPPALPDATDAALRALSADTVPWLVMPVWMPYSECGFKEPNFALCRIDAALLSDLRALRTVSIEHRVKVMQSVDEILWDERCGCLPEWSELLVYGSSFQFRGWFEDRQGVVVTDELSFGRTDVAIEQLLAARSMSSASCSPIQAAALAADIAALSTRTVAICLLATGDLYAGAASERAQIERDLLGVPRTTIVMAPAPTTSVQ